MVKAESWARQGHDGIWFEAIIADVMATCLFFVSSKLLLKDYDFEYLVLYADRSIEVSSKFPLELFKK